ncbi:MAG TPA: hypothetical protein VJ417_07815 [Candidatus Glassbacteria bacterium]|nr:hypothetical protein [Candidatus Glassbacteria bacterium]
MRYYKSINTGLLAGVFIVLRCADLSASVTGAWAVDDGQKIYRYQTGHALRAGNSSWD